MANFNSVTVNGSDTKVSTSSPAGSQTAGEKPVSSNDILNGNSSVIISGSEMHTSTGNRNMSFQAPTEGALSGIFSTLKDPVMQRPINDATMITPECRITIQGAEVEVKTALMMGLIGRDANGFFDPATGQRATLRTPEEQKKQQAQVVRVDFADEEQRATITEMKQRAGISATDAFFMTALGAAVEGKSIAGLCEDFAQRIQAEPNSVFQFTQEMTSELLASGLDFLEDNYGVNPKAVAEYIAGCSKGFQKQVLCGLYLNAANVAKELVWHFKHKSRL